MLCSMVSSPNEAVNQNTDHNKEKQSTLKRVYFEQTRGVKLTLFHKNAVKRFKAQILKASNSEIVLKTVQI